MNRAGSGQAAPMPADARELARMGMALLLALALPCALAWGLDERTLLGVSVWSKPLKFAAALSLQLATLVWLLDHLPQPLRRAPWVRATMLVGVLAMLVELFYIVLQAARGRPSHFNNQTALESFLYVGVMGTGAVLIVASAFVFGWLFWRRADPAMPAGLRRGAAWGLMLGSAATLVVTIPLSAGFVDGLGHWVGGVRDDAGGLPLTGWSRTGGDLRVPHFFATHLVQLLPAVGWLADRVGTPRPARWVDAAALVGLGWVVWTLVQALRAQPFIGL